MGILGESVGDAVRELDFTRPRVIVTDRMAVLENVDAVLLLTEEQITVSHGRKMGRRWFTTVSGKGLIIKEIGEGRILIGGEIRKTEFLQSQGTGQDRGVPSGTSG